MQFVFVLGRARTRVVCICTRACVRKGGGEKGDHSVYVMFVLYYCLRVASTFSFWNKEFLDLTWLFFLKAFESPCNVLRRWLCVKKQLSIHQIGLRKQLAATTKTDERWGMAAGLKKTHVFCVWYANTQRTCKVVKTQHFLADTWAPAGSFTWL